MTSHYLRSSVKYDSLLKVAKSLSKTLTERHAFTYYTTNVVCKTIYGYTYTGWYRISFIVKLDSFTNAEVSNTSRFSPISGSLWNNYSMTLLMLDMDNFLHLFIGEL